MTAPTPEPVLAPALPAREAFRASLSRSIQAAPTSLDEIVGDESPRLRIAEDRRVLEELLAKDAGETRDIGGPFVDEAENLFPTERDAFPDMLDRLVQKNRPLSDKQRDWVYRTAERMHVATPGTAAPVPRGREVETPAVLRSLPLAPPGRKAREEPCKCGATVGYGGFHYLGAPGCRAFNVERWEPAVPMDPDRELERRFGPSFGFTQPAILPSEDAPPAPYVDEAGPDDLAFLEPMAKNLALPEFRVRAAYERALEQVRTSVVVQTSNGQRRIFRTPEGDLDNCAAVNGEPESTCQACGGECPDKGRIRRMLDRYLGRKSTPAREVLDDIRTGRDREVVAAEPTPFDGPEEDDLPF